MRATALGPSEDQINLVILHSKYCFLTFLCLGLNSFIIGGSYLIAILLNFHQYGAFFAKKQEGEKLMMTFFNILEMHRWNIKGIQIIDTPSHSNIATRTQQLKYFCHMLAP